jgi:hypothetical protein
VKYTPQASFLGTHDFYFRCHLFIMFFLTLASGFFLMIR